MNAVRPLKFVLVGTYSSLNKGDRLMQEVMAEQLRQRFKSCKVSLLSPFPALDRPAYSGIKVEKASRRNLPYSTILVVLLILLIPFKSLRKKLISSIAELNIIDEADLVIDLSGDMLTEDYGPLIALSHSFTLILPLLLQSKYCVVAQSIGKFKYLKPLYRYLLNKAQFVSARESITAEYLHSIAVSNVVEVSDLGFLLKPDNKHVDVPYFKALGRKVVGISPSALLGVKFAKWADGPSLPDQLRLFLKKLVSEGFYIVFVPHVAVPKGKSDFDVALELSADISNDCTVLRDDLSPAAMKELVGKLDYMVAFRMHAAIAALDQSVPTVLVSYSHKSIGLAGKLGIEELVIPCDEKFYKNIETTFAKLLGEPEMFGSEYSKRLNAVRVEATKNIDLIESVFEGARNDN